jgi:hypothetical protein
MDLTLLRLGQLSLSFLKRHTGKKSSLFSFMLCQCTYIVPETVEDVLAICRMSYKCPLCTSNKPCSIVVSRAVSDQKLTIRSSIRNLIKRYKSVAKSRQTFTMDNNPCSFYDAEAKLFLLRNQYQVDAAANKAIQQLTRKDGDLLSAPDVIKNL